MMHQKYYLYTKCSIFKNIANWLLLYISCSNFYFVLNLSYFVKLIYVLVIMCFCNFICGLIFLLAYLLLISISDLVLVILVLKLIFGLSFQVNISDYVLVKINSTAQKVSQFDISYWIFQI